MRLAGAEPLQLVHPRVSGRRKRGESAADAPDRRTLYRLSVLRQPQADGGVAPGGTSGQSQAGPAPDATDGAGVDCAETLAQPAASPTGGLPVPATGAGDRPRQSGLVERYHLPAHRTGVCLPGGGHRLAQSLCPGLAAIPYDGYGVLRGGAGGGDPALRHPGDLQYRSRQAVYQRGVHRPVEEAPNPYQHGRQGSRAG